MKNDPPRPIPRPLCSSAYQAMAGRTIIRQETREDRPSPDEAHYKGMGSKGL
jgi:hypothetical protein